MSTETLELDIEDSSLNGLCMKVFPHTPPTHPDDVLPYLGVFQRVVRMLRDELHCECKQNQRSEYPNHRSVSLVPLQLIVKAGSISIFIVI